MHLGAESLALAARDPDPVDLLAGILAEAARRGASRVHFEPHGDAVAIRLRVGDVLADAMTLDAASARETLACAEGQPGIMVARLGERAVLTFETVETRADDLCALGMRPGLAASLADILARRAGLVLVAGPPGSGVSTTLAALARRADNGARCILSGDDDLPAVLGQDPDVVTIARIADRATAAAAIRAARERLVLAGIEASDSVSAILALRAFRAEPFDLAANLQAVLSQRLVGHLCAACREPVQAPRSISALLGFDSGTVVYAPAGCEACGNSGFTGRTAAFEAILPDTGLRRLIYDGGDGAILARHAFVAAPNLGSAARTLVREGVTTPEEAVRVSRG